MKKIVEGTFLVLLVCFSFFYTERVIDMINKEDPLMIEIVNVKSNYEVLPVNAIIDGNTIIPGIRGREIDIKKSYENMKISGVFREEALVFNDLFPSSSLYDNRGKYIVKGNGSKKEIAILTIFNNNYINKIKGIDNITIFVNHKDLAITNITHLKEKEIYTYGNNGIYSDEVLTSDNTLINRLSNNKSIYCLAQHRNDDVLEICNENNMYVVIPNIVGGYYDVKNNLSNGSIILLNSVSDIDNIIRYIESKGYDIVTLSKLLSE